MKEVKWARQAQADVRDIDRQNARRILETINRFAASGQGGDVKRLRPPRSGLCLRVGDWRVFFRAEPNDVIRITRVLHRSRAYR